MCDPVLPAQPVCGSPGWQPLLAPGCSRHQLWLLLGRPEGSYRDMGTIVGVWGEQVQKNLVQRLV